MLKMFNNKKGVEMTMQVIVIIIILLVLVVVMLYIVWGRSQTFSGSTSCPPDKCTTTSTCPGDAEPTLITCSKETGGNKVYGRCCP